MGDRAGIRIDPVSRSISATVDLGEGSAVDVVANEERVWVAVEIHDGPGRIFEIDTASNRVVREIPLGTGSSALALGGAALWAGTGPDSGGTPDPGRALRPRRTPQRWKGRPGASGG